MNPNGVLLEHTLKEILAVLQPESNDWVARFQVIEELRRVVDSLESMRGATVEPFGSFVSNLFTRSGDLDISIELANGSFISSSGKKHKQKLLRALMEAMRQRGGWNKYQCIPNARVPILKVQSNIQNISCDISVDNLQAQMKSKMLLWITEIDTRFRDMVLLVKEWAKAHNINNSKTGTFNSYSLSLLVVFHFQTCVPAIFPPLKDIYPGNIADDLQGLRANAERQISETCAANIARFRSQRGRAVNHSSLSDLFISFLSKFSNINSRASELGICPFTGQWEYISSNTRWLPQTHAIFVTPPQIEDPFGQPENSARAVNASQLTKISEAFQSTYRRLVSRNQNQNDFLAPLVRQQTSQLIPRNQRYNPHSVYQPTRPQWLTADFSHPPQYARHGSGRHQQTRPQVAYLTTRVPNARAYQVQNQQQQLWRPRSRR
ncbi:protein HESO1 isoform X2 [Morus notabilis]|uniref:protein HESO1 isoform X2 n=1 Tax=Morus notabilis TaxID=981085 RepID=UPI000CED5747|nr:protein HESO1 isoform X2 [Morus notabilis]